MSNIQNSQLKALSRILEEILERAGLRARMQRTEKPNSNYLKEISLSKGFRKRFNTTLADAKIKPTCQRTFDGTPCRTRRELL